MSGQHRRRLLGWLSYAFASEVFVVVSLTLFLPICLEQFARDNGFLDPHHTTPCVSTTAATSSEARCSVKIGWLWIDSASFSLYVYSTSVALQALTVISMGSIADRPSTRKPLLLAFALAGATAATSFFVVSSTSPAWWLSAVCAACANVGFGASVVAMNAYLPGLAREAPEVVEARRELELRLEGAAGERDGRGSLDVEEPTVSAPLLAPVAVAGAVPEQAQGRSQAHAAYVAALSRATARISAQGIASGYIAGIVLLLVSLVPVTRMRGSTWALRLAIGSSGVWWMAFSIPAAVWLPGGGDGRGGEGPADKWTVGKEVCRAWTRLGVMLRWSQIKRLRHTFLYLGAWFLLSDGFTTITSTAILFGKTTLHMSSSSLVLVGAITPASGILGSLAFPWIQRRAGWTNQRVLVILVVLVSCIPAYGCLGFVPWVRGMGVGGLTTPGEMFALAVYFGFAFGAFQSYARASYAELIPPGEEARWYALYSITDKSSSFLGPLVVGLVADVTGDIRYAFFFLVIMVWLAVPVLSSVDFERGRIDAQRYAVERRREAS